MILENTYTIHNKMYLKNYYAFKKAENEIKIKDIEK